MPAVSQAEGQLSKRKRAHGDPELLGPAPLPPYLRTDSVTAGLPRTLPRFVDPRDLSLPGPPYGTGFGTVSPSVPPGGMTQITYPAEDGPQDGGDGNYTHATAHSFSGQAAPGGGPNWNDLPPNAESGFYDIYAHDQADNLDFNIQAAILANDPPPRPGRTATEGPRPEEWDERKSLILALYAPDQANLTLTDTMGVMASAGYLKGYASRPILSCHRKSVAGC